MSKRSLPILSLLSLLILGLLQLQIGQASPYTNIDVDTACNMITSGLYPNLVVLDVRTKDEYDSGHIYGAVWIPVSELEARIGELTGHENHEIIVYCRAGSRSATASGILDSHGFTKVHNMVGGILEWQSAGYPVWIATVHNINTTFNYDTIQAAIDAPQTLDGHTVLVDAGTYYENVVVAKSLSLVGTDKIKTIVDGNYTETVIGVTANNVNITGFTIRRSGPYPDLGIYVSSSGNNISYNIITNNDVGIYLHTSSNNTFSGNNITNNNVGIGLDLSTNNNIIFGNNFKNNNYRGISIVRSSDNNSVYHNNFVDNTQNAYDECNNVWDDGYPSGGNYWSDYGGVDYYHGPYQDELGNDGIGDTLHVINENNTDNYPLMVPWGATPYYDWPMFHHDPSHTGYSASTAPNTNNTIWSYITGGYVRPSPAVAYGKVYVGSFINKVFCLNASTGTLVWNYTTGDNVASPTVADGKVYVGSHEKVYCLDATIGTHIWNYTTGDWVWSSPAVADGKVYVGSGDKKVYCLNASDGTLIWSYTTSGPVHSSPAVINGKVYVGSYDDKVYCLNAATGAYIWNYTTEDDVYSSPAVADGKVYVASLDNKVYCLDASTGTLIWNYTTGSQVYSSPAVADGKVYVGSYDDKVYCLNAATGAYIWGYTTGDVVRSSPAVAYGRVFVGSHDGKVYAFGPVHDVAVTNVTASKTVVGQGYSVSINVTVENQGDCAETFNVTSYANETIITTHTDITITSLNSKTILFIWNTTGFSKGNYTIGAIADTISGETDTTDNTLTDGWIIVAMLGDITGGTPNPLDFIPDGKVDMKDIATIARYFGQNVPPAPPNCDITGPTTGVPDGKVDMRDVATAARHFGEKDP